MYICVGIVTLYACVYIHAVSIHLKLRIQLNVSCTVQVFANVQAANMTLHAHILTH